MSKPFKDRYCEICAKRIVSERLWKYCSPACKDKAAAIEKRSEHRKAYLKAWMARHPGYAKAASKRFRKKHKNGRRPDY